MEAGVPDVRFAGYRDLRASPHHDGRGARSQNEPPFLQLSLCLAYRNRAHFSFGVSHMIDFARVSDEEYGHGGICVAWSSKAIPRRRKPEWGRTPEDGRGEDGRVPQHRRGLGMEGRYAATKAGVGGGPGRKAAGRIVEYRSVGVARPRRGPGHGDEEPRRRRAPATRARGREVHRVSYTACLSGRDGK